MKVVSSEEWKKQRLELLAEEKEFTRQRDALFEKRSQLPWVLVDKEYQFDSVDGLCSLKDLFRGSTQLIVYHFMYGPHMEKACPSCTLIGDHFIGLSEHLKARDTQLVLVSRGPLDRLLDWKKRLGWDTFWVSSQNCQFNQDYQVTFEPAQRGEYNYAMCESLQGEMPGLSVFALGADGQVYHSYSNYGRGLEDFMTVYRLLDVVPRGRDEGQLQYGMQWVKYRDQYQSAPTAGGCCSGNTE